MDQDAKDKPSGRRLGLPELGIMLSLSLTCGTLACANADGSPSSDPTPADPDGHVAADSMQILEDLRILSHDSLEGRRIGTPGGDRARAYLLDRFVETGLEPAPGGYLQPFEIQSRRDTGETVLGGNVVGYVPGTDPGQGALVITAHFDHLGIRSPRRPPGPGEAVDSIFNGADDNASGTAGLLSMARYFAAHPGRHTLVFAALDGEEMGLRGSRAFVERGWPERIAMNVNLDMISRSDSLLFVAGTYHYPHLKPIIESVDGRPPVLLRFGHDEPGVDGVQDWTGSSDHRPFHELGIPFLYFGVEDHSDYHRASDEFEVVDPRFFLNAVRTVLASVLALDQKLGPGRVPPRPAGL